MPPIQRRLAIGKQRGQRARTSFGDEVRTARIQAGVSQRALGEAVHVSTAEVSRIERGIAPWLTIERTYLVSAVLGLSASLRVFPEASPLRDRAHLELLDRFRTQLHPSLTWRTEVPLPAPGDLRAWDGTVSGVGWMICTDAETKLHDVQAVERRLALKQRDGGGFQVVLLIAGTRLNRSALAAARPALRGLLPHDTREILAALRAGVAPPGSGVVVL